MSRATTRRLSKGLVKPLRNRRPPPRLAGVVTFCPGCRWSGSSLDPPPITASVPQPAPLNGNSQPTRFRKPFRLLAAVSVVAWPAATAAYVGLTLGYTLTPAAPAASLLLLLGVSI